jgi:hypothetical protein
MGIILRFLCNSLSCFPVFLVFTFHKDPRIIIPVVVVVHAAAAADDVTTMTTTTTTMMEDMRVPFCCSAFVAQSSFSDIYRCDISLVRSLIS